jgi:hypothetical protein
MKFFGLGNAKKQIEPIPEGGKSLAELSSEQDI